MTILDCRNKTCPTPVVETRKQMLAEPGIALEVLVGDDIARENVARLAAKEGYAVEAAPTDGGFSLRLVPTDRPGEENKTPEAVTGATVVLVTSDAIGSGDDELGAVLMKNFIMTLEELETLPDKLLFLNGGVKLTCQGTDLHESLERLACKGVDIVSCGLCLDFFDLKDKLVAGRIGNMLETVETLSSAGRIIRP